LTEITAVPGAGAVPPLFEGDFVPPPELFEEPPADEEEAEDFSSLICWANGSLLAKRLKDVSVPSASVGAVEEASDGSVDPLEAGA
jgi:hypothetical protein